MGHCGFVPDCVAQWLASLPDAPVPPFWVIAVLCTVYLVFVLVGRKLMENREPIPLKNLQVAHNAVMFVYSLMSTIAMGFGVLCNTPYTSFSEMICDSDNALFKGFNHWVLFCFLISKMWEFVDTVFLVFGKHRIRFLHVYHHVITLPLSWLLYVDNSANGNICAWTNMFVHTPMYYYYTLAALGLGARVWWKKYITQIQITQFVFCMAVMVYDVLLIRPVDSVRCTIHKPYAYHSLEWSAVIYLSFLVLFIKLYIDNYKVRAAASKAKAEQEKKLN